MTADVIWVRLLDCWELANQICSWIQSYVNMTLFHEVKFVESDRLVDLYLMPRVVKYFNLSDEKERPGGTSPASFGCLPFLKINLLIPANFLL